MAKKRSRLRSVTAPLRIAAVYISYSRRDGAIYARKLADFLGARGINVGLDIDGIAQGESWATRLQTELQRAQVLILIATPAAMVSEYTEREVMFFFERREYKILPIVFDWKVLDRGGSVLRNIQCLKEEEYTLQSGPSEHAQSALLEALKAFGPSIEPVEASSPRVSATRPLNEGKLILVGRGEVGKTSLVKRLISDSFRGDESMTQGINITRWMIQQGTDTIRMNVWDFGGQEIMHATHQFFLTERSIYLLVLNGREGGEDLDADYWLKHLASFGGDSQVIIVQNKISQHPFELNYRGLQSRYPQIRGFVRTDCKDRTGVDELRELLSSVVATTPEIRMNFPLEWFRVKERLESKVDSFVSYDEFRHICSEEGIDIDSERDTLSWALHCLGIALNFKDDSRLRETSVLKPEWVTQGIYKILNSNSVAERRGELNLKDLGTLLTARQYPADKHAFLLELMRKFSLCFAFPDQIDIYLIPELLGKEESREVGDFRPDECLNFEYEYGVLPEGLMPRFIVRSHTLSQGQDRWRSGVILSHEGCRALITAQPAERRIIIRITGGDAGARRRLLAIIRYDFDRINGEFKDRLDVQAKVPLIGFPTFAIEYQKLLAFEKNGVKVFPEFVGQRVATVNVGELLNGVDFEAQRREPVGPLSSVRTVFFSYSHKDEVLRDELETHLKLLQRQNVVSMWHDRKLLAGDEWDGEIDRRLDKADIVLLLVSADFIASDYCWGKEVQRALDRHKSGEATVIPVLLRACDWGTAPFGKLQGLPKNMKPITSWNDRDSAWSDVAAGIRRIAERL